jgi:hypothetical protein
MTPTDVIKLVSQLPAVQTFIDSSHISGMDSRVEIISQETAGFSVEVYALAYTSNANSSAMKNIFKTYFVKPDGAVQEKKA